LNLYRDHFDINKGKGRGGDKRKEDTKAGRTRERSLTERPVLAIRASREARAGPLEAHGRMQLGTSSRE